MAQPTISDVHVNIALSNLSILARQRDDEFVADVVFPTLPVESRSNVYWAYNKGDFLRNQMAKRGPGTESAGGAYRLDSASTYLCDVWSLHRDIPDQIRANADSVLNMDMDAAVYLQDQARLNREIQWATAYFAGSIWTTDWTGVASGATAGSSVLQWNDSASTPIQDIRLLKQYVQLAGLLRPNTLVIGRQVFDILCDHPDFIERVKFGQTAPNPAQVTKQIMAALFEVDRVLVMDGIQNTASEDPAWTFASPGSDLTAAFVGGKHCLLAYTPVSPGLMVPAAGYTFSWSGYLGSVGGSRIKSMYLPWLESTRIEIDNAFVQKVISKDLGGFISGAVA